MLDQKTINELCDHAAVSELARYKWPRRGVAPIGYVKGMACTYALCLQKLAARDSAALAMVRVVDDAGARDVFDHYAGKLKLAGIETEDATDIERLRALFVILMGLGMRESSGGVDIGRDSSASNTTAETAEAGLFQQSWDSRKASPEIEKLAGRNNSVENFAAIFREGVELRAGALENYGDGDGRKFQELCKGNPAFAAQVAAIGLRTLCTHWGPIVRREVELSGQAVALFKQVEKLVGTAAPIADNSGWFRAIINIFSSLFGRKGVDKPTIDPPATDKKPPWMTWAEKEVGFHEQGRNHGIDRYSSLAKCGSDGDPWCAIFVNAALEANGINGSRSAMARSFERDGNFVRLDGPAYGAITTMWRGSNGSGLGHVFFYAGENDRGILALGGNQNDQVRRQYEPHARIVGYWWPRSQPLPKIGKVLVEADADEGSET